VAEVYLKKKERIEALSMIMVLSLLIYSIAEWMIRKVPRCSKWAWELCT
jgi:transposase